MIIVPFARSASAMLLTVKRLGQVAHPGGKPPKEAGQAKADSEIGRTPIYSEKQSKDAREAMSALRLPHLRTIAQILIYGAIVWIALDLTRTYAGRGFAWTLGFLFLVVIGFVLFRERKKIG
jgi:hypothetical protein